MILSTDKITNYASISIVYVLFWYTRKYIHGDWIKSQKYLFAELSWFMDYRIYIYIYIPCSSWWLSWEHSSRTLPEGHNEYVKNWDENFVTMIEWQMENPGSLEPFLNITIQKAIGMWPMQLLFDIKQLYFSITGSAKKSFAGSKSHSLQSTGTTSGSRKATLQCIVFPKSIKIYFKMSFLYHLKSFIPWSEKEKTYKNAG